MRVRYLAALLVTLLAALPAAAQEQRGAIEGTVRDESGAAVPGASVEARSAALVGTARSVSDASGLYRFPALPPGRYEVTASLSGFTPAKLGDIVVTLGKTLRVDLTMKVAAKAEEITVTGESPVIDVKSSASAKNFRHEDFELIPKGRDFTSIVKLAPGANFEERAGGIAVDGASGAENSYILDGVDTTNLQTGVRAKRVVFDVIEEVQVKSSGFAAEYGGAIGGVINVVTRSGANNFFGEVGGYFSSDALNGMPRQFLRRGLQDSSKAEYVQTESRSDCSPTPTAPCFREEKLVRFEPGFTLGGPIKKDRVWFFASYIPEIQNTDRTVTFTSNSETKTFREKFRAHNLTAKVNAQLSAALRGYVVANVRPDKFQGRLPSIEGTDNPALPYGDLGRERPNASYSMNLDYVVSNNLYFNVRGGYFYYDLKDIGIPNVVRHSFSESNQVPSSNGVLTADEIATIPPNLRQARSFADVFTNSAFTKDNQNRLNASLDGTYFANAGGHHTFKAGVQLNRIGNDVEQGELKDLVTLGWGTFWTGLTGSAAGRDFAGTYGYYSYRRFQRLGNIHSNNIAVFGQDSWEIAKRLTLNLGLRAEREYVPSFNDTGYPIKWGFGDKLAPRAGFAWDINGDGRTKVYGSAGVFYDNMKLEMPRGSFGGERWIERYYTLDTPNWPSIGDGNYPGTFIEQINWRNTAIELGLLDPDIEPMRSHEFTLGAERQIGARSSIGVRYVRKRLDRTIEDVGVLGATGEEYFIANPGFRVAEFTMKNICPTCPSVPHARRDYDSVEARYVKRYGNRWYMDASYLWSRLFGNYNGLANSDELRVAANNDIAGAGNDPRPPGGGRTSPNVNRAFDLIYDSYKQDGTLNYGLLPVDRTHQVKVSASYSFPFNLNAGIFFYGASGTPQTTQTNIAGSVPVFYKGRGDLGRTDTLTQTDLYLTYDIKAGGSKRVQISANVTNVFDQDAVTGIFPTRYLDRIVISNPAFFAGFDAEALGTAQARRPDPRYGQPFLYQYPREIRLGLKFMF
jgi:outer membrane receptor protein involved in Fe transport